MPHRSTFFVSLCALAAGAASPLAAQQCEPHWAPEFFDGSLVHPSGSTPRTLFARFEDTGGPALAIIATDWNPQSTTTSSITALDGSRRSPLGTVVPGAITAISPGAPGLDRLYLAIRDVSSGTSLLAGWTGNEWEYQTLGTLPPQQPGWLPQIDAMHIHDDGSGNALYVTGLFFDIAGIPALRIARWDGQQWEALPATPGSGFAGKSLITFDDGTGPALYIGGRITMQGGISYGLIRWRNGAFETIESPSEIKHLAVFDDGSGPALYASHPSANPGIVRWDNPGWTTVLHLNNGPRGSIQTVDTPAGERLVVTGEFILFINGQPVPGAAQWDGQNWSPLGAGRLRGGPHPGYENVGSGQVAASFDSGEGPLIYLAGGFLMAGEVGAWGLVRSNGQDWLPFGEGITHGVPQTPSWPSVSRVAALAVHDDGQGPHLYAGGSFAFAGGQRAGSFARLDNGEWTGLNPEFEQLHIVSMQSWNDGSGDALYLATPNSPAGAMHRFQGGQLAPFAAPGPISALAAGDIGAGHSLFAGGSFGLAANNGNSWSMYPQPMPGPVLAIAVFDDGAGPKLYAGGDGGITSDSRLVRWTGAAWERVGGGIFFGTVRTLHIHDGDLYAGGMIQDAGGAVVNNIARWDGQSWSPVGNPHSEVYSLGTFDDGTGTALYAGLTFRNIPAGEPHGLARWNESSQAWESVGGDVLSHTPNGIGAVLAIQPFAEPHGQRSLFIGGDFASVAGGAISSHRIAQYIACPAPACYANCDGSTASPLLNIDDFLCFIDRFSEGSALPPPQQKAHYANCDGSAISPTLNIDDFMCFIIAFATGCP